MKRFFAAALCILMLMLTACQPTPDVEYVVNKGDNEVEDKINSTPLPVNTASPDGSAYAADTAAPTEPDMSSEWQEASGRAVFPQRWEDDIQTLNKELIIQADVTVAEGQTVFPVHLVGRCKFTSQDVKSVGALLMPEVDGWANGSKVTRAEIEEAMAAAANSSLPERTREDQLEYLRMIYNDEAVDSIEYTDVNSLDELLEASPYGSYTLRRGDELGSMYCTQTSIFFSRYARCGRQDKSTIERESGGTDTVTPELSLDTAKAHAESFLQEAGIEGFEIASAEETRFVNVYDLHTLSEGWILEYVRTFGYYPVNAYKQDMGDYLFEQDTPSYGKRWDIERIEFQVDGDGVFACDWRDPMEDMGTVNENVQLMDFDSLTETIKRTMTSAINSPYETEGYYVMDEMVLTVYPCRKKDSDLAYMMPVWVCRISEYYSVDGPMMAHWYSPGEQMKIGLDQTVSFNAIDGSTVWLH